MRFVKKKLHLTVFRFVEKKVVNGEPVKPLLSSCSNFNHLEIIQVVVRATSKKNKLIKRYGSGPEFLMFENLEQFEFESYPIYIE